jgi:hypothetical protein
VIRRILAALPTDPFERGMLILLYGLVALLGVLIVGAVTLLAATLTGAVPL